MKNGIIFLLAACALLIASPALSATTGLRVKAQSYNASVLAAEMQRSDGPYQVQQLDPQQSVLFSDEATAYFSDLKAYYYQFSFTPKGQTQPYCQVHVLLVNVWDFGPKIESCKAQFTEDKCSVTTSTDDHCNVNITVY